MIKKYSKSTEEKKEIMVMRKPLAQFKSLPAFIITIFFILLISTSFISAGSGSFFISNKSNEGQEFFSISGITGRAGIGVASPLSILHIDADAVPSSYGAIIESNSSQSGSVSPRLGLIDAFNTASSSSLVWYVGNYGTDFRIFRKSNLTVASSTESVALSIDSSTNNVGIGTTNPYDTFEVNGSMGIRGAINRGPTNVPLFRWLAVGTNRTYTGTGTYPRGIAFDGINMWVTGRDFNSVTKITPTGVMTNYTGTGRTPQGIAFDGVNMWTANYNSNSVTKITPAGVLTNYTGTGFQPNGIAFDGANIWTANYNSASVTKITPTGTMTNYTGTGLLPEGIAFDGTNMWTANTGSASVTKITPAGTMTNYTGAGAGSRAIAFDGTNMWAVAYTVSGVTKIFPNGTMVVYTGGSKAPITIAFDGVNMWTASFGTTSTNLTKITPAGVMTNYTGIGSSPDAIAFDGTNMWVTNPNGNSVTKTLVIRG